MKTLLKNSRLWNHPLMLVLRENRGNPRTLTLMEPLWGIPYNLIAPFATLYMYMQGITDVQIGLILSIAMVVQVFFSFSGGIITDKLGRKRTTLIGDFMGWSMACLIWAISSNFWLFLLAALLNSFEYINQTSWFCLLIEDAKKKDLVGLMTLVTLAGLIAVFFAPISGLLIQNHSVVPVVRVLYLIFSLNMAMKVFFTWRFCQETKQGKIRKEETKDVPIGVMLAGYKQVFGLIIRNKEMLKMIAVTVILRINQLISTSFFGLFVTQRLEVAEEYLAYFPILNAAVMLVFMVFVQHYLEKLKFRLPMWGGLILYGVSVVLLILTPVGNIPLIIIYIFLAAVATAVAVPRANALLQINIEDGERARISSVIVAFSIAFVSPFGYIAGWLSSMDRRLPFALIVLIFIIAIIIVGRIKEPELAEEK